MSQAGMINRIGSDAIKITSYNVGTHTWTKDSRSKLITIYAWTGGNGGGSGRQGTSQSSSGGGGGAAGAFLNYTVPASYFGATETVVVSAGGAGAPSQTTPSTNGIQGSSGGITSIGNLKIETQSPGSGGGTTSGTGGPTSQSVSGGIMSFANVSNGYGSGGNGTNSNSAQNGGNAGTFGAAGYCVFIPTGGGGGAGASLIQQFEGADGGNVIDGAQNIINAGGIGGVETSDIDGSDGNSQLLTGGQLNGGTGGGGGGGQSTGLVAGNGGDGGFPGGGGGGGGASMDGTPSGAGGDGGDGYMIVIEYF